MASALLSGPVVTVLAASQVRDLHDRDGKDAAGGFLLLLALWLVLSK